MVSPCFSSFLLCKDEDAVVSCVGYRWLSDAVACYQKDSAARESFDTESDTKTQFSETLAITHAGSFQPVLSNTVWYVRLALYVIRDAAAGA